MKDLLTLRDEIGEWATRNFDYHAPHLGVGEEAGELTHAVLKNFQGIRQTSDHLDKVKDAIADAGVFLMHWFSLHSKHPMVSDRSMVLAEDTVDKCCGFLLTEAGFLIQHTVGGSMMIAERKAQLVLSILRDISQKFGFNFYEQLNETWEEVRKRDWRMFPKNGLTE